MEEVCLNWGNDRLFISEPAWCKAIVAELYASQPELTDADDRGCYSRREAESSFDAPEELSARRRGLLPPAQRPIAAKCLRELLGLELPAAIMVRSSYSKPERFIALDARLQVEHFFTSTLHVQFGFDGLQLYSTGHIGQTIFTKQVHSGSVLSRSLDNTWWSMSFDGRTLSTATVDRWSFVRPRNFYLRGERLIDETGAELRTISA